MSTPSPSLSGAARKLRVDAQHQPSSAYNDRPAGPDLPADEGGPKVLTITLRLHDQEVIEALQGYRAEAERQAFAAAALKVGVAALKVASGKLDADLIQRESTSLLQQVGQRLQQHTQQVYDRVNSQLKEYFDPDSGRFNERVKRLISHDGELEQVLRRQIGTQDSELAKTLVAHFGEESPLMKRLSPTESEGLIGALRGVVEEQLRHQRERVLSEFSLDNQQGALARLVGELTKNHGQLHKDLHSKIDEVVKEFSLDQENSALSRLVRNVDSAQRTIVREFSLDNPESAFSRLTTVLRDTQGAIHGNLTLDDENAPLARLKRELLSLLQQHSKENTEFREEVKQTLAMLVTKRQESEQSTRHGLEFEEVLGQYLGTVAQRQGDILTSLGAKVGKIKNCKVGDFAIELGPDCQAAGAKIVLEAKEETRYGLDRALEEIQTARKNRDAQIGVFVFSAKTAPPHLDPFGRYGDDLIVIWDPEQPASDVYLDAALAAAKALCVRAGQSSEDAADFDAIQRAILEIEKRAGTLDEVRRSAETIQSASQKILDRIQRTRQALEKQVQTLHAKVGDWLNHSNPNA